MAKKSRQSVSRKHHSRRKHSHKRRTHHRRRGGAASVNYSLSDGWSSQMSRGQGADFFNYHRGQHGGVAPLSEIGGQLISPEMRGPAHVGGIDKAILDVRGLTDQAGGKRKSRRNKNRRNKSRKDRRNKSRKDRRNKSRRNKSRRSRGGAQLSGAPFPSQGMLLDSPKYYAQAGLNPEWRTDVAYDMAKMRQGM
jgi:hypothetical protein